MTDHLPTEARDAAVAVDSRRYWAAMMLARDVDTFESICLGRPVIVANLEPDVLRLGLRGRKISGREHLLVDERILDAIAEAGASAVAPIVAPRQQVYPL